MCQENISSQIFASDTFQQKNDIKTVCIFKVSSHHMYTERNISKNTCTFRKISHWVFEERESEVQSYGFLIVTEIRDVLYQL